MQQRDINGKGEWFINSGVQNFGIKGRTDRPAKIFPANTITVDFFGNAYYRPFKYKMATHNHVFSLSGEVIRNQSVGLYLVTQMSYLTKLFTFNNMGTWSKIKHLSLLLPVTSGGNVDYKFIEERMRELEEERMRELEAYLKAAGFEDCTLTEQEKSAINLVDTENIIMKKMRIVNDVFNVKNSHNILKSDVVFGSGNVPYVTASEGNNSIVAYISYNEDEKEDGNTILIGGKTLVITYQPQAFFSNDSHNLVLRILDEDAREEDTQLYLVASLYKSLSHKYSWGNSISKQKIQSDSIYLPTLANGKIDYQLMKTYIRAIKKECIARLKAEIKREQEVYREVID